MVRRNNRFQDTPILGFDQWLFRCRRQSRGGTDGVVGKKSVTDFF
jgi:hypothetical protein